MKFLYIMIAVSLLSCNNRQERIRPVVGEITESVYASGTIKSRNQYQVYSTVSGLIEEIVVTEGDLVRKGDPIMRLVNMEAELSSEHAAIAARQASLSANADKLRELRQNIEMAKAKMDYDALLLNRQRALWSGGIGTRNDLDTKELAYKTSKGSYESARLRYTDLERQLNFQAAQANKSLQISQTKAADYIIRSDVDGRVFNILKEQGEAVNPQTAVALIGDAAAFIVELQVDEYDIVKIKPGQKVVLGMDSYKGQVFEATVEKINPAMVPESRSFTVNAAFVRAPSVLYPNLTAEANIIIRVKETALTIPRSCLMDGGYVLMASGERRKVGTGIMDYQRAEITSGLATGDIIVKPAP